MDIGQASILIMDAIGKARAGAGEGHGVFIVDGPRREAMDVLRMIVETLDYRIDAIDSDRTNLNDLEVGTSPLREKARFRACSEMTYVSVLRGWCPEMSNDPRIGSFRRMFGDGGVAVILSDTDQGIPERFVVCDLSRLAKT